MSRISRFALAATLTAAAIVAACMDSDPTAPPAPARRGSGASASVMGTCTDMGSLEALARQVFGEGSPNVNSVLGKLDNLEKKVLAGDTAGAHAQAMNIVTFVRDKAAEGTLPGTQQQITQFISGVLCYAGLSPDTFLILPTDDPQVRLASDGLSGVSLEGNTVNEPTLLTITSLDTAGTSPLVTELDQYPSYVSVTASSALTKPAVVAVCPAGLIPPEIRSRLRLGHQAAAGFEITPPASADFLPCTTEVASALNMPHWVGKVVSLFVPRPLYAAFESGGVGGSATEFSPFGAVDPVLGFSSGGVGGSTTEFIRLLPGGRAGRMADAQSSTSAADGAGVSAAPRPSGDAKILAVGGACTEVSATVGTELEPACRPLVIVRTHNGTVLENVPVAWAVTAGGGGIAPSALATSSCGTFGSTAATTTDAQGKAGICWTLGPEGGTNSATAAPSAGGDAPDGVTFQPTGLVFNATGLKITPTVSATGGTFVFDNAAHAGSGSCSDDLVPELSYSSGEPVNVGEHTLTVTCGAGSNVYNAVSASAAIVITPAVPSVSVSCPTSVVYDGTAQSPCSATVTAPGLSLAPTPSYTNNVNVGTATAVVALAAGGNYAEASGSATFEITPAATTTSVTCSPATLAYTGAPLTPCSATTSGPGGLAQATAVTYASNVDVGTATATAAFAGGGNYLASSGSATFTIEKAATVTTVSCPASVTFTGAAQEPCSATAAGPGGLSASVPATYANNVNAGTALVSAAYAGGPNHLASSGSGSFTIAPAPTAVTVSCPASVAYDGTVRNPCSASVSAPALSAPVGVTYSATPLRAGTYTAGATFEGSGNYLGSAGTATFAITQLSATATAGSATINFGAAVPTIPCTVSGVLSVDAGSVTCATSVPPVTVAGSYTTTPVVTPASPVDYAMSLVTGVLTVAAYVQVNCFERPVYSVMPPSKSAQRKGSNLPVKCTLTTPQGAPVTTARGDLVVEDRGTDGLATPVVVFSGTDVFKASTSGNYAYGLDTSPGGFVAGHYYYVTATWNDGSKTQGWFLLK